MRVRIERTFLTTTTGTRVIHDTKDYTTIEAESLATAVYEFIVSDGGRLLGTVTEHERKAVATAWRDRVYLVCAEPAPD